MASGFLSAKRRASSINFGKAMDKLPDTWRVYVLSSHPDFERCYGRFADKKRKLYNGMLKCDLFMYGKRL